MKGSHQANQKKNRQYVIPLVILSSSILQLYQIFFVHFTVINKKAIRTQSIMNPRITYELSIQLRESRAATVSVAPSIICLAIFPTVLGSASSLTGCSWIPVFYMERLPFWPPQPSYWVTRYRSVRLVVRLSGFWLPVTTVKDLQMTAGTYDLTCHPRHGGISVCNRWSPILGPTSATVA